MHVLRCFESSHMARSSVARSLLALRISGWINGNTEHRTDGYILGAKNVLNDCDRTMELSAVVTDTLIEPLDDRLNRAT